ncbi:MAG: RNA polymerase-associated protein RapA [Holosporales bacterium]
MLINVSYKNQRIYFWAITDSVEKDSNGMNLIKYDTKILKKIASRSAVKTKFVSKLEELTVTLPTKDGIIDPTGLSPLREEYIVKAYGVDIVGFTAFSPSRFKKEYPKKDFVNVHFSNSFMLTHLFLRIAGILIEARSYYPKIVKEGANIHALWQMYLDGEKRFYFENLTNEMPEVFFMYKPEDMTHFEYMRHILDRFTHAVIASISMEDTHGLKRLKPHESAIINQLLSRFQKPIETTEISESEIYALVLDTSMSILNDNDDTNLCINVKNDDDDTSLLKIEIGITNIHTKEYTAWDEILKNKSNNLHKISSFSFLVEQLHRALDCTEKFHIEHLAAKIEKFKQLQAMYGVEVLMPQGMTHVPVLPTAIVEIEGPESEEEESLFSPAAIANVKWKILLGDHAITLEELQKLADEKKNHYINGDLLIPVDPSQLQQFLKNVKKMQKQPLTPFDILRADVGQGVQYNVAAGWIKKIFDQLKGEVPIKDLPQPDGLLATLRPYQMRGFSWLTFMRKVGLGACLADDMGLGKTIQTISYMLHLRQTQTDKKLPFLLICPTSLLSNWQRELSIFAPSLTVHIHHGVDRQKDEKFEADVVITSYSLVDRDLEMLKSQVWDAIILDEAQNIKNANTKQTLAVKSLKARHRILLTGTPIENRPSDIWSLMDFCNHGLLGAKNWFNSHFSKALSYSNKQDQLEASQKMAQQLKMIVGPFMLRRLKTDTSIIVDLPEKIKHRIVCPLSVEQTSLYKACVDQMMKDLEESDGFARRGLILKTLVRLKQICNHPGQLTKTGKGDSGKLDVLHDLLEDILDADEKVLIFTQFKEMGDLLVEDLKKKTGQKIMFLNGSTPAKERGTMVRYFQESPECKIFILSLKAGGTGLNLTAANHVVHYDRWWNPAVEEQATSRAHRIGQEKIVSVHTFVCEGTIEDRIDMMIEKKIALADSVVGEGEGWITELSDAELKDLLTLKKAS